MDIIELIEGDIDFVIARTTEQYATFGFIMSELKRTGASMKKDIAVFAPGKGINWITGKNSGKMLPGVSTVDNPVDAAREVINLDSAKGVFIFPMFGVLEMAPIALNLTSSTSYLRLLGNQPNGATIIAEVSPGDRILPVLYSNAYVMDIPLPDQEEVNFLQDQMQVLCGANCGLLAQYPQDAIGLNRKEVYYAGRFCKTRPDLNEFKKARINASDVISIHEPEPVDSFDYLVGLENLKDFTQKTSQLSDSRGILLVGVPGTGKSAFAKAYGNTIGVPTINFHLDRVFDKWVGSSEDRMAKAIGVLDNIGPCVVFIDEIEKSLGGMASSNRTDGGTGSRVFSMLLKWLGDRKVAAYVIATSNDVSAIPPEFIRAERWDSIFFIDVPGADARAKIAEVWSDHYKVSHEVTAKDIDGMTGAEIRTLIKLSRGFDSIEEAGKYVIKITDSMADRIQYMRSWSKTWACDADSKDSCMQKRPMIGFR